MVVKMGTVMTREELLEWRAGPGAGKCVALVRGSFDLLHPGHIRFLEQARQLRPGRARHVSDSADGAFALIAVVEPDESVRARHAGAEPERPITPAPERMEVLAALEAVDIVTLADADDAGDHEWLARLHPNLIAMGNKPGPEGPQQEFLAKSLGADFQPIPLEPGHSTAALIARMRAQRDSSGDGWEAPGAPK